MFNIIVCIYVCVKLNITFVKFCNSSVVTTLKYCAYLHVIISNILKIILGLIDVVYFSKNYGDTELRGSMQDLRFSWQQP
jgi:hypothetical protein